jgi:hypothetical protein
MESQMSLPCYGKIGCSVCHGGRQVTFNRTITYSEDDKWRITANPMAWGSQEPVVVALGFSKGGNAVAALRDPRKTIEDIPYAGKREWVGRILHAIGCLETPTRKAVDRQINDTGGLHHFGSLVRCTVEQKVSEGNYDKWISTGNGMLENFSSHPFGRTVIANCGDRHLNNLPPSVKIIVLFGLGKNLSRTGCDFSYVANARQVIGEIRGRSMTPFNGVSYYDEEVVVVHTEHFSGRNHLNNWLDPKHPRNALCHQAKSAVAFALQR